MSTNPEFYTLITGSSSGIGKQLAFECARKGFSLFLVSLPGTGLLDVAREITDKFQVKVVTLEVDLTQKDGPQAVFEHARNEKIRVNILINNAGVGYNGSFANHSIEKIDKMILLNLRASTLLTFYFLPEMKELDQANILNISSFAAFCPMPYKSVYSATKTYLLFFSRALDQELKDTSVTVTSVHPSGVATERVINSIRHSSRIARVTTLTPEEVAKYSIRKMLKGDRLVVPGIMTKLYYVLGSTLPHGIVSRLVGYIFRKAS